MRLSIVLATVVVIASIATTASAAPREIAGPDYATLAITDTDSYWFADATECTDCVLMRTNIASGLTTRLLRLRRGEWVTTVHSGGDAIAFSTARKSDYSSRFITVRTGSKTRVITTARWNPKRTRKCGSVVYAGPVSSTGEVTMHRSTWTALKARRGACSGFYDVSYRSEMLGQTPGAKFRSIEPRRKGTGQLYFPRGGESISFSVVALNDRFILRRTTSGNGYLLDRATGARSARKLGAERYQPPESELGSDGALLISGGDRMSVVSSPGSGSIRRELVAFEPEWGVDARFCGDHIVQLSTPGNGFSGFAATVTALDGSNQRTLIARDELLGHVADFECNAHTAVFQVTRGEVQIEIGNTERHGAMRNYVLDLG